LEYNTYEKDDFINGYRDFGGDDGAGCRHRPGDAEYCAICPSHGSICPEYRTISSWHCTVRAELSATAAATKHERGES